MVATLGLAKVFGTHGGSRCVVGAPGPSLPAMSEVVSTGTVRLAVSWAVAVRPDSWTHWLCADHDVYAECVAKVPETTVIAVASRCIETGVRPRPGSIVWDIGPTDDRGIILPGMVTQQWCLTGEFEGQRLARAKVRAGNRLLCPGSSLVAGVHLAAILLGGIGEIALAGADGRLVDGRRRSAGPVDSASRQPLAERQLRDANECLERSRDALAAIPGLVMRNETPGSAIRWGQHGESSR